MGQRTMVINMVFNFISKCVLGVVALVAVNCTLNGQEVEILGKISDGSQAPLTPPKIPPRLQTIQSVVHRDQNRSVALSIRVILLQYRKPQWCVPTMIST